ncbi:MAG TPA: YciI family protein [Thermomicrobiaceae bacterium]|nr:YciI family protein [Thermomicrobiaceae bacterium]
MKYLLMLFDGTGSDARQQTDDLPTIMAAHERFTDELRAGGHYLAAGGLQPRETATTVRVRDGEVLISDGPFAEAKEQIGGFYLVEAGDLDEALTLAARVPYTDTYAAIEIRPVF